MVLQIVFVLFIMFVLTRVIARWRGGEISLGEFIFWSCTWAIIATLVLWPGSSSLVARALGVGRGTDAAVYTAILVLFYAIFRIVVKLEFIEHEITQIVRMLAIREGERRNDPNEEKRTDQNNT